MPEAFNEIAAVCKANGLQLDLVQESRLTGPLGGVVSCRDKLLHSDACLIFSGDALDDINLQELVATHYDKGAGLTVTTDYVGRAEQYGVLDIDE